MTTPSPSSNHSGGGIILLRAVRLKQWLRRRKYGRRRPRDRLSIVVTSFKVSALLAQPGKVSPTPLAPRPALTSKTSTGVDGGPNSLSLITLTWVMVL